MQHMWKNPEKQSDSCRYRTVEGEKLENVLPRRHLPDTQQQKWFTTMLCWFLRYLHKDNTTIVWFKMKGNRRGNATVAEAALTEWNMVTAANSRLQNSPVEPYLSPAGYHLSSALVSDSSCPCLRALGRTQAWWQLVKCERAAKIG